jgi:hypothetical protein
LAHPAAGTAADMAAGNSSRRSRILLLVRLRLLRLLRLLIRLLVWLLILLLLLVRLLAQRGCNRHRLLAVARHTHAVKLGDERLDRIIEPDVGKDRPHRTLDGNMSRQWIIHDLLNLYLAAFEAKHYDSAVSQTNYVFLCQERSGDGSWQDCQDEEREHRPHARLLNAKGYVPELFARL